MAKKKMVTLAQVKAAVLADLTMGFEKSKKAVAKAKTATKLENSDVYLTDKTYKLLYNLIIQENGE
jgi:hypothetical protein